MVAYKAHNLVVGGSSPPAVTLKEVAPQRNPCFTSEFISSGIQIVSWALIIWSV